jgi:hypothetical protein
MAEAVKILDQPPSSILKTSPMFLEVGVLCNCQESEQMANVRGIPWYPKK